MHLAAQDNLPQLLEDVVREIYRLGAVNREVQRRAVPEHPPACLQALALLARTDASRVSDIAERLRIDLSVASRQVAVLESSGWVTRQRDPRDGRARQLEVTTAGQAVLEDAHERMVNAYGRVLEGWSEEEIRALTGAVSRLRDDFARLAADAVLPGAR
jgi:DNA-binding MarR family transcriptional regulator